MPYETRIFVMLNNILNDDNNDKIANTINSVIFANDDLTESAMY